MGEGRDHKKDNKVEEYADSICNSCEGKILEGKQSSPKQTRELLSGKVNPMMQLTM